jgi:hypothetical protein
VRINSLDVDELSVRIGAGTACGTVALVFDFLGSSFLIGVGSGISSLDSVDSSGLARFLLFFFSLGDVSSSLLSSFFFFFFSFLLFLLSLFLLFVLSMC